MSNKKPLCSIIIPTYNRSELLRLTLTSMLNQCVDSSSYEIIVVDDGSADDTEAVFESFAKKFAYINYYYQKDEGYRVATARNVGIKVAKGEICIFIDSGVVLGSNCINEHLLYHQASKNPIAVIGYVYGFTNHNYDAEIIKETITNLGVDKSIDYFKATRSYLDVREKYYDKYGDKLERLPAPWVFFWTTNVSVKKNSLVKVGLFDVNYNYNWGMEDLDLGYRLNQIKVKIMLNRNADSIHFPHDKDMEENLRQNSINKIYFNKKYKTSEVSLFMEADLELNDVLFREKKKVVDCIIDK